MEVDRALICRHEAAETGNNAFNSILSQFTAAGLLRYGLVGHSTCRDVAEGGRCSVCYSFGSHVGSIRRSIERARAVSICGGG